MFHYQADRGGGKGRLYRVHYVEKLDGVSNDLARRRSLEIICNIFIL